MKASPRRPLLEELRRATRDAHRALDQAVSFRAPSATLERYVAFLQGSLLVVEPLEQHLRLASESASRAAALRKDLAALGSVPSRAAPPPLPSLRSRAACAGARYVLEGSSLGGVVLARELGPGLGLENRGLHYLTLYADRVGARWKAEVAALESWGQTATSAERSECCQAARAVFEAFHRALRTTSALAEVA